MGKNALAYTMKPLTNGSAGGPSAMYPIRFAPAAAWFILAASPQIFSWRSGKVSWQEATWLLYKSNALRDLHRTVIFVASTELQSDPDGYFEPDDLLRWLILSH